MMIELPRERGAFEKSFEKIVENILCLKHKDLLTAVVNLIATLRTHSITSEWIKTTEEKNQTKQSIYEQQATDAFEDAFHSLWRSFPQLATRRRLVKIIHFFTKSSCASTRGPINEAIDLFVNIENELGLQECSTKFLYLSQETRQNKASQNPYAAFNFEWLWDQFCILEKILKQPPDAWPIQQVSISGKWPQTRHLHIPRIVNRYEKFTIFIYAPVQF